MSSRAFTLKRSTPRVGARPSPWGDWGLRGAAIGYIALVIVLPLLALIKAGFGQGLRAFWASITSPIAASAVELTIGVAVLATLVNACLGTLTAFVLVRYDFPGRELFNAAIDLPFAIPTLVTGVMLVVLYGPQSPIGNWLAAHGVKVIFASPGIVLAMLLVTYPFVIRAVQPVLVEMELDQEEAAYTLGAGRWTAFWRIVVPGLLPAIATGSMLTFARALGEFGAIVVVAGNIPGRTLTAPVYIYGQIETQNQQGASALSVLLVALSFALLFLVDRSQRRREARHANG
ncbi:MAG TPA: sulfate ABC transporter permease subunit CysT [Blastocatellia bacterium]|nr:sulfate ABC transporter permease subunit CysT [Blastocatellia bacterium]